MPFGRAHLSQKDKTVSGGVTDVGHGLQALAAALTDPETLSAYQEEDTEGKKYNRTFYHGMRQIGSGLHSAGDGISQVAGSLEHAGDSVALLANSVYALANSVVDLKGAIQPLSKSINHFAAGATAVGLTVATGASGWNALMVGLTLLMVFVYTFHNLL